MINLEDQDFNKNVLQKIKEEKLEPRPKWRFLLKNSIVWGLGIFSLILGAVATSLVFYMITGEESGLGRGDGNPLEALLFIIPFFWIICMVGFSLLVFYYIKHTKKGYKYSAKQIIIFIVAVSLLLGGLFSLVGANRLIDDALGENAPFYDRLINPRLDYWSNPENGRLTGLVISRQGENLYYLVDRSGEVWVTMIANKKDADKISIDRPVKLVGKKVGEHGFLTKEVLSVGPGRGFFRRPLPPGMPKPCHPENENNQCNLPLMIPNN